MQNKLSDLNNHLFAAMERLSDEDLTGDALENEIKRAKATASLGHQIIKKCDCSKCEFRNTEECPMEGYHYVYDCPEYKMTQLNQLIDAAHANAVDHGWWDKPKSIGELLALIHSEVTEALEEHRNGHKPNETYYSGKLKVTASGSVNIVATSHSADKFALTSYGEVKCEKPEGIPAELADIVIRVFDMCGFFGIDLEAAIKEKMAYNKSRPYKHGGKKL